MLLRADSASPPTTRQMPDTVRRRRLRLREAQTNTNVRSKALDWRSGANGRDGTSSHRHHPTSHRAGECDGCRRSFNNVPLAPVLEDVVWCKLAAKSEVLCAACCFSRALEREVDLTRANLPLCELNLAAWPFSYFNLFTHAKKHKRDVGDT